MLATRGVGVACRATEPRLKSDFQLGTPAKEGEMTETSEGAELTIARSKSRQVKVALSPEVERNTR